MTLDANSTVSLALALTLVAAVWRISAIATELKAGLEKLTADVKRMEAGLSALTRIPIHDVKIEQLERVVQDILVRIDNVVDRMGALDRKIAVTREKVASMHDVTMADTEPPPKD